MHKDGSIRRVSPSSPTASTVVAAQYMGKRFNAPNDVTIRSDGTVYFSDPDNYQSPQPAPQTRPRVYRVSPAGDVSVVDETIPEPNGVTLSLDEKTLFVDGDAGLFSFAVMPDGSTGAKTPFGNSTAYTGSDGMAMDCAGDLYVVHGADIAVLGPTGSGARAHHDHGRAGRVQRRLRRRRPPDALHHDARREPRHLPGRDGPPGHAVLRNLSVALPKCRGSAVEGSAGCPRSRGASGDDTANEIFRSGSRGPAGVRPLIEMVRTHVRPLHRSVTLGVALLAAWLAASGVARAEPTEQETIAKIVELNREGVAQYQKKHFDVARKVLKQALELCESAGLDRHPVAARTHIHLGIVIISGFGQREIGSRQFNEALQIDPNITLTPGLATPAAEDVFNEALVAVSPKSAPRAAAPAETPAPSDAPAAGRPARAGRRGAARPRRTAEDDAPRAERRAPAPAKRRGTKATTTTPPRPRGSRRASRSARSWAAASGWASGMGDVNADTHVSGSFAAAKLGHLELEGGYWLTDELMLSLEGRFQVVTGPTIVETNSRTYHPATYATAVFAEGTWSPAVGRLRPYVSGALGRGQDPPRRHAVAAQGLRPQPQRGLRRHRGRRAVPRGRGRRLHVRPRRALRARRRAQHADRRADLHVQHRSERRRRVPALKARYSALPHGGCAANGRPPAPNVSLPFGST